MNKKLSITIVFFQSLVELKFNKICLIYKMTLQFFNCFILKIQKNKQNNGVKYLNPKKKAL